ncbi:RNA-directed DNA polymerase, eukaryota [Tanacetum coccineum]
MVFDAELSINIILSGLPADYNQFVLSYQMNRKETSIMELHNLLQTTKQGIKKIDVPSRKAAQGKSDRGSKRKDKSEIVPTSDPKEAVCFYCNIKGHWKRNCPKYLKDLKDRKVEKEVTQGLKESRRLKHGELNLVMGNRKITHVRRIGKREAQDKLEAKSEKCLFVGYPKESFGYLFYKPKDNVVFVARKRVFLEREMLSKEDSRSKIDLEEIQESADEEPIVNTDTQQEVVTPVEPDDISLPIHITSSRVSKPPKFYYGFHIEEDKISDSTLTELDEPTNYNEAMASPKTAKWKEAMKTKIQSMYDNQVWNLVDTTPGLKTMDVKTAFLNGKLIEDVFMAQPEGKCFAMKDLGDAAYILGIKIYRDRSTRLIGLSQDTYLDKILKIFKMENFKKGNLPLHHGIKISKDLCLKTNEELDKMSRVPYASANPSEGHWTAVKNILKYLRNTKDRFLVYGGQEELKGAVTWKSSKKDTVADSTCESDYIAACEASKEAICIWLGILAKWGSGDKESQSKLKENTILYERRKERQ